MNHHHRYLFSLACLASPLIALFTGCSHRPPAAYQGYVEGKFVYVASPQSGRLDRLSVSRGATIAANQPLFTLDREPELSAELQARQVLRSDERRLADLKTGKRPPEIDVIAAQLAQAKVEHQKSIDILKSDEEQYAAGGLPQTDLIDARAAVASNAAVVRQYQSDLDVAALPGRDDQIKAQAAASLRTRLRYNRRRGSFSRSRSHLRREDSFSTLSTRKAIGFQQEARSFRCFRPRISRSDSSYRRPLSAA